MAFDITWCLQDVTEWGRAEWVQVCVVIVSHLTLTSHATMRFASKVLFPLLLSTATNKRVWKKTTAKYTKDVRENNRNGWLYLVKLSALVRRDVRVIQSFLSKIVVGKILERWAEFVKRNNLKIQPPFNLIKRTVKKTWFRWKRPVNKKLPIFEMLIDSW